MTVKIYAHLCILKTNHIVYHWRPEVRGVLEIEQLWFVVCD